MAYPDSFWQQVKIGYEIHGYSYGELAKQYGLSKATIHKRSKKESWDNTWAEPLIQKQVQAEKDKIAYFQEIASVFHSMSKHGKKSLIKRLDENKLLDDAAKFIFPDPQQEKFKQVYDSLQDLN